MTPIHDTLTKLSDLRLTPGAKARIRADLAAHADFHTYRPRPMVRSPFWSTRFQFMLVRGAALTLIVIMSGATSQASTSALPGDVLYPVKTRIAEPVRTALIPSSQGKASWQAELAERRLEEATTLAVMQKLDPETEQKLAVGFKTHVEQSLSEANKLEQEGDLDASLSVRSKLEARVTAHEDILATVVDRLATTTNETAAPVTSLLKVVSEAQNTVEAERMDAEVALASTGTTTDPDAVVATGPVDAPAPDASDAATALAPESPASEQIAEVSAEREIEIAAIIEKNSTLLNAIAVPIDTGTTTAATTTPVVSTTTEPAVIVPEAPAETAPAPAPQSAPAQMMKYFRSR